MDHRSPFGHDFSSGTRVFDTARMKVAVVTAPADKGGWYRLAGEYTKDSWPARAWTMVPLPPLRDQRDRPMT
ncbi:hypothetical protein [Streptomyces sp. TRM64462]|uniref:hypothetical protein n=1 Tax=Streptomyces sp. TRM64462 TaxID=2741726 RepID=UPI0015860905|nr:hypothetical protein [Streptomyces sp. TRM64462]